jgi:4-amino-4-deoxy-L-arabinose transferase-like glycosyltransferase
MALQQTTHRTAAHLLLLLAVGVPVLLADMGQESSIDGREISHAEISREMVETGLYAVPHLLGRPYIDKPPVFNWTVALLFKLTGRVTLGVARLPSALSAMAVMVGLYVLGRRWFTARAALWASLMWASYWLVVEWAHMARGDMLLTAMTFFGLVLADLSATQQGRGASLAFWCAASVAVAGGVMSKGPQALLYAGVPIAAMWRARRGRWGPPVPFILLTLALAAAVAAAWVWAAEAQHPGHLRALVGYQFGKGLREHPKRLWLYVDQILIMTAPWALLAPGAAWWTVRRTKRLGYGLATVPGLVFAVFFVMLTALPNKRIHYALPVLPMWALLLAAYADQAASPERLEGLGGARAWRRGFELPLRAMLCAVVAAMVVGPFLWASHAHSGKAAAAAVFVLVGAVALWGLLESIGGRVQRAMVLLFAALLVLAVARTPLEARSYYSPDRYAWARQISQAIPRSAPVAVYEVGSELLCFKMDRPLVFAQDEEGVRAFLAQPGARYLVTRTALVPTVTGLTGRAIKQVGTWQAEGEQFAPFTVLLVEP